MPNESLSLSESRQRRNDEAFKALVRHALDGLIAECESEIAYHAQHLRPDRNRYHANSINTQRNRINTLNWIRQRFAARKTHQPRTIQPPEVSAGG